METSFQYEHILAHGCKNIGNKTINEGTGALKNPGIGTVYLMVMIYVKELKNQGVVAAYKAGWSKTADWICKYTQILGKGGVGASEKRRSGIGIDYLMVMIYVMEIRIQGGVESYKATSSKTADLICKYTQI